MVQYTKETKPYKNQSTGQKISYNWILQHPQVVVSPIANYCIKLFIDRQVEPQLVSKLLLKVLARELHNIMMSQPKEFRPRGERDSDNNIIISD